jgi:hypothetical protein
MSANKLLMLRANALERVSYRTCYRIACWSGSGAAFCAHAFRGLGSRSAEYGPLVVLAQLPVLAAWVATRAVFLLSAAPCFAIGRRQSF